MDTYETSIYRAVLITAAVVGSSIIYFVISVFRQQRSYLKKQRQYFTDEVNLLEKDRNRVAIDLHDDIGPLLNAVKTYLEQLEPHNDQEAKYVGKAKAYLTQLVKRMGQIAMNLTPNALSRKGLQFTLQQFLEDLSEVYSIRLLLRYEVRTRIDTSMGIHLYRIIQEIANNTIKHAKASKLDILFKERKGILYVFCKDNGTGFAVDQASENRTGLGLSSLQSRTAILKGKIDIRSEANKGTQYFFEFPLSK
jgi:signal transduction histidine kinase